MVVSEVIGVPPNHPSIDGLSIINHPFRHLGLPPFMEAPYASNDYALI